MKMDPFPPGKEATATDLVRGLEQVHDCVELGREQTRELKDVVDRLATELAHMKGVLDGMARSFGLPGSHQIAEGAEPSKKAPKMRVRWDIKTTAAVVGSVLGSLGGLLVLVRILDAVSPVAWHALLGVPLQ